MNTKRFSLRTVLTVTTGRLLTVPKGENNNGIGDLYDILGWMTDDEPYTHQLGRFSDECKPYLLQWFPEMGGAGTYDSLAKLDLLLKKSKSKQKAQAAIGVWIAWIMEEMKIPLRSEYDVPKIPKDDHTVKDAEQELVEMRGGKEGITVIQPPEFES